MKTTYYVASSLDGYIAKADGDVSWLEELDISIDDTGYNEFYATVDALVMGRKIYEMIKGFGEWPYGEKPVWVGSSNKIEPMEGCNLQKGSAPAEAYKTAQKNNIKHLWLVGGGSLVSSFIENNLLTNMYLSLIPIALGSGIKLFGNLSVPIKLKNISETVHESGMVQLEYTIKGA